MTAPGGRADLTGPVAAALARLPASLADTRARQGVMAVARALPRELTSGPLGLELRLAGETAVDLFAAAVPGEPAWDRLVAALGDGNAGARWTDPGRARDLAAALERWRRGEGALPRVARYLLLEADAPSDPSGTVAVPSIFLAPRGHRDFPRPGQPPNLFHRSVDGTVMAAAELAGVWPDPATASALAEVVAAIPDDGDVFAVGAMVSRAAGASIRVAVRRLDVHGLHAVLGAARRPREADVLAGWVSAPGRRWKVAFEVGPGAEPRVGLELSPEHDWKEARLEGWPELLDDLVARGVAEPERAAAVPGLVDREGDPLWGLSHVKVSAIGSAVAPAAKLYVGLRHGAGRGDGAA